MTDTTPGIITELIDEEAANALASIIVEHTADVLHDADQADAALRQLCADTGLVGEVGAAILTATTAVAVAAGGVPPAAVFAAAAALRPEDT